MSCSFLVKYLILPSLGDCAMHHWVRLLIASLIFVTMSSLQLISKSHRTSFISYNDRKNYFKASTIGSVAVERHIFSGSRVITFGRSAPTLPLTLWNLRSMTSTLCWSGPQVSSMILYPASSWSIPETVISLLVYSCKQSKCLFFTVIVYERINFSCLTLTN